MNIHSSCAIAGLSGLLFVGSSAHADFVGVSSQVMDFSNGYLMANGSLYAGQSAAAVNANVSSNWSAFSQNFVVMRFYANFSDQTDRMIFFGSTEQMQLDITTILPPGQQFFESTTNSILPPNIMAAGISSHVAFDSWLSIGAAATQDVPFQGLAATPTMPASMLNGLHIPPAQDGIFALPTVDHDNNAGTPDIVNPITLPDANGRVLFAQITVPRSTLYGFRGSIAYLDGTTGLEINSVFAFASVPAPGAISLLALAGLCGRPRRRRA